MRVYIGYDSKEKEAYQVAERTLKQTSSIQAEPLNCERLAASGLFNRAVDTRGQPYDLPSNAPCSTEFATSRFLVPILCQSGWAMFTDCDMVFMQDVHQILEYADESKAVMVVKHNHQSNGTKMGGLQQTIYPRKNWSSVMLFQCDHPANKRLTIEDVNRRPGRDLHAFYWLHDSEIGELPNRFNWLVDVQPKPDNLVIAHMTLGGPWIENWQGGSFDDEWMDAAQWTGRYRSGFWLERGEKVI